MNNLYEFLPDELTVTCEGAVRVVTMNRPNDLNATNEALHNALSKVWAALRQDNEARVVVLTGAGKAFSAGGDFQVLRKLQQDASFREVMMEEARTIITDMVNFPLPIIAAINGPAVGLGCSLALCCDLVYLSSKAIMSDPHLGVGLVAGDGGAALWPIYTSMLRAKEFIFTGENIRPELAVELGLANRVVDHEELMSEVFSLAKRLQKVPKKALSDTKRAMNMHIQRAINGPLEAAVQAEITSMASPEHIAIIDSMLERK